MAEKVDYTRPVQLVPDEFVMIGKALDMYRKYLWRAAHKDGQLVLAGKAYMAEYNAAGVLSAKFGDIYKS